MEGEARGLSSVEARRRLATAGRNELRRDGRRTIVRLLWEVVREPMVLLLLGAMTLYLLLGDTTEAIALVVSVAVVIALTVVQERRTERALDALRTLASPRARVRRDGVWRSIDARELVPGDVVQLAEGDRVPADAALVEGTTLTVDESLLTGESVPVIRHPGAAHVFAGTLVGSGDAIAVVTATGPSTQVGQIGAALGALELASTPLHEEVRRIVRWVAAIAAVICVSLTTAYLASGRAAVASLLAGITLAMALLPEEMPIVLVVFLALGARRIAQHHVLARRAATIEAIGAMTVLCVDKTGTLTRNEMRVAGVVTEDVRCDIAPSATSLRDDIHEVIEYGALACPPHATDPMDRAFVTLLTHTLGDTEHVHPDWTWIRSYPLRPGLLAVTHVWRSAPSSRGVVATKGAPEAVIDLCHLDEPAASMWRARAEALAREGYRMLGVARGVVTGPLPPDAHDLDFEMLGLVALNDPLREDTGEAVRACRDAGIRVVMITGDHPATARAIAEAAGLAARDVMSGSEVDLASDDALADRLARVDVVARAAPLHKLRIVQALRARGEIVGMTGDGVNDAPALKAADIGIAMGRGTDVAREAAGLILVDEALHSISRAVATGRRIYDNLRKVAAYLIAVHLPIAALALVPPLVGWPPMLSPLHIVLLQLVIDPTCSIVFELEPAEADVMRRPPRRRDERLVSRAQVLRGVALGVAALIGPLAVLAASHANAEDPHLANTSSFLALIAADIALVFAALGLRGPRNPAVPWMVLVVASVVTLVLLVPPVRMLFDFALPPLAHVGAALLVGAGPVLLLAWFAGRRPGMRPVAQLAPNPSP